MKPRPECPALLPLPPQGFKILVAYFGITHAPAVVVPAVQRKNGGTRPRRVGEDIEASGHNVPLHGAIPGLATGIAEREVSEHETRNTAMLDYVQRRTQDDCGDTSSLQVACNQTHGLMAYRSQRDQHRDVNAILLAASENFGGIGLQRLTLAVFGGRAVESRREGTKMAVADAFLQMIDGEIGVEILEMSRLLVPGQIITIETSRWRNG